jgi:MFS transporter, DHA2 family, metal-tetracycline-proton antiporter
MGKDAAPAKRGPRKIVPWIAYLIFFAVLNETVFNVSTPKIAAQFSLSPSGVSWMMTVFMVLFGIGAVIYGKLSDIFSLRSLIRAGVGIYVGASLLGFAFRDSYPAVLLARALQGVGGSAIPALVFVVIARHFEVSERGGIFGMITSVVSLAIGFGPVIGGAVSSALGWPFLFILPVPILLALPFIDRILGKEARRPGRVDVLGAALTALMIGSLVTYLNLGAWQYLAAFALLALLFVARMRGAKDPFIEPRLFANAGFRSGLLAAFSLFSIVIGVIFVVPLMLSRVHGLETARIGLVLFPGAISSVLFGPLAGTLADRRGSGTVIAIGLALLVSGMLAMAFFLGASPIVVAAAMLLIYVGFALFQTAMVNAISQTLPPDEMGVGMGLFNLVGILSGAIGTAIVGSLLDSGRLSFALLPTSSSAKSLPFENLMLLFALVAVLGGGAYLRALRPRPARQSGAIVEASCLDPAGC